jgi:hypothetical protein
MSAAGEPSGVSSPSGYTKSALVGLVSVKSMSGRETARASRRARESAFGERLGTREENMEIDRL